MADADGVPVEYQHTVVVTAVQCRRCTYDLRGLPAMGVCPECATDIWGSVLESVDPEGARMPRLTNPRAVGNALLLLAVVLLLAAVVGTVYPLFQAVDRQMGLSASRGMLTWLPDEPQWFVLTLVVCGVLAVVYLSPPVHMKWTPMIRRGIWELLAGIIIGGMAAFLWIRQWSSAGTQAMLADTVLVRAAGWLSALAILDGLREVFQIIGQRSRQYRRAEAGTQGLGAMIAAVIGIAAGELIRVIAGWINTDWLVPIGTMIRWVSLLMLLIGLLYLVMNAWWVRRALRHPPPWLGQILMPDIPSDTTIITEEDTETFVVLAKGESPPAGT